MQYQSKKNTNRSQLKLQEISTEDLLVELKKRKLAWVIDCIKDNKINFMKKFEDNPEYDDFGRSSTAKLIETEPMNDLNIS